MEKPKSPFSFRKEQKNTETTSQYGGDVSSWHEQSMSRRTANKKIAKGVAWAAGLGIVGLGGYKFLSSDETEIDSDSLALQIKEWNVGATETPLSFDPTFTSANASVADSDWKQYLDPSKLMNAYMPADSKWQPAFVPELMQSLSQETLKAQMKAVRTPLMQQTFEQGLALRELLAGSANANESLIISELEGTSSVALGAALADFATIIPTFGNLPHPFGVVRSHETLGAMLYYAQEVESKKANLKPNAPALLMLDSQRVNPYSEDEKQLFDNRYMAKVPSAADLKQRGITSILYVVRDASRKEEMDDLNDVFVDYQNQGINIRFLPMSEFRLPDGTQVAASSNTATPTNVVTERRYYYGGSPMMHWWWYSHYSYNPYPGAYTTYGGSRYAYSRPTSPAPYTPTAYRATSRPTVFSGTRVGGASGVGRARPSGFGRTSVRVNSSGSVTGVRSGRSGSFGRSGGGWFGG